MQTHEHPLIFVVDDNSIYNQLVAHHLRLHKFDRIECFLSGEECLQNLYKKPDIVIQDYLMEGINGIAVLKESKKRNPHTEFVFLSGFDNFEVAADTIKYGAYDYVVKDRLALKKLLEAITKIRKIQLNRIPQKPRKIGITFFLITFALVIMTLVSLPVIFPKIFTF